jgi:thiol-disulfide isomerase/thioredoxin
MTEGDRRLVYVTVPGCAVCREKAPLAEEIADDLGLPLERVDRGTEEGAARAEALRVRGVPTLALVDGERVPFRLIGSKITREAVDYLLSRG